MACVSFLSFSASSSTWMRSASGASGLKFGWCFMNRSKSWSVGLMVKRGMGNNSFLGNKKGRPDFLSDRPMKKFYCGEKKKAGVEISFRFRPWPGVFSVM